MSPDHKHLAYAVDISGNESYAVYVRNIAARSVVLVNPRIDASHSMVWAADSSTLFYASVVRVACASVVSPGVPSPNNRLSSINLAKYLLSILWRPS